MFNLLLPVLLPSLASALPAPVPAAEPTLFTFTYEGNLVTATWEGTSTVANPACPTQTFTYNGAAITVPYTGPGTPQSCLTTGSAAVATPAVVPGAAGANTTPVAAASSTKAVAATTTASVAKASGTSSTIKGFNYGSTGSNGAALTEAEFASEFSTAAGLVGTSGFTSARLYTMIQAGTTNTPIEAIPAAISTGTKLLLGLWASAGQSGIDSEITALKSAISQYGTAFTDLINGISVGSEDLYRISPTGIENKSGVGAEPSDIVSYVAQVRSAIAGTSASGALVGHVDTWNAWTNGSNAEVVTAVDFIGMDAYPYFQTTYSNAIGSDAALFAEAYEATVAAASGKPVWVTETGYPVSGATMNLAVPSVANAKTYWDAVGCDMLFDKIPTYWYTLNDNGASPSFGVETSGTTPLYDLSCSA